MLGGPYRGRVYAGALRSPASGGALLQPRTDPSRKAPASPWTGTRWAGRNGGSRSASPPRRAGPLPGALPGPATTRAETSGQLELVVDTAQKVWGW